MGPYSQSILDKIAPKGLNRKHVSFGLVHIPDNDIQRIIFRVRLNQGQGGTTQNVPCRDRLFRGHRVKFIQEPPRNLFRRGGWLCCILRDLLCWFFFL